jgi:hypothetical protein
VDAYGLTGIEPTPASGEVDIQNGLPSTNEPKEYSKTLSFDDYVSSKLSIERILTDGTRI